MSGFEVAGVVLGVLPLVIELADRWKEISRRLSFLVEFRDGIMKCRQDVRYHDCTFKQNLKQLLRPIFEDDEQVERLIRDPKDPSWINADTLMRVQIRLRESYEPYMDILARYHELMSQLRDHLGVNIVTIQTYLAKTKRLESKPMNVFSRQFRQRAWKQTRENAEVATFRLSFANRESERKELFGELDTCNSRLARLLSDCDKDVAMTDQLRQTRFDKAICDFWKGAESLFSALLAAWGCSCWQEHTASLLLTDLASNQTAGAQEYMYRVVFLTRASTPWHIRCTQILERQSYNGAVLSAPQRKRELENPSHTPSQKKPPKKRAISFQDYNYPSVAITCPDAQEEIITPNAITSLCTTLVDFPEPCCGYICDELDWRYYISPDSSTAPAVMDSISLEQLIHNEPRPRLMKRLVLARTLASSFVQLAESQWLPTNWAKKDIIFYPDPDNPNTYQLDKPHIRRDFEVDGDAAVPLQSALNTLGVVLWEIGSGRPVDVSKWEAMLSGGMSPDDRLKFEFLAAHEKVGELAEEVGNIYASAVEWCLSPGISIAMGRTEWRAQAMQNIVLRLDECLDGFGL